MARLFPLTQTFVDTRDGNQYYISRVKILSTGTDFFKVPPASDVAILQTDRTASDPTFYLSGNNNIQVNIDGDTVGTERVVITRHRTMINFGDSGTG